MAPLPDDDDNHYQGGAPLDGGSSPSDLAGSSSKFSPTALEIGIIVGVVALVIMSIIWLFVWRSRRSRAAKNAETPAPTAGNNEELNNMNRPRILSLFVPNDEHSSIHDHDSTPDDKPDNKSDDNPSVKKPEQSRRRPVKNWEYWIHPTQRNEETAAPVEQKEIANRVYA
ncbi:hypothetical protein F5Y15DRAFT_428324 [Xylariaceae sp. FL0016]|nr:hypothetical protein F5Y15DRAFT_428324 [Xylariaceae sp. FL0016]